MRIGWIVLFAGCSEVEPGGLEPPVPFAACAVPVGGFSASQEFYFGITAQLSGPILDAGVGDPPDNCFEEAGVQSEPEVDRATATWFRAADADGFEWIAGLVTPAAPTWVAGEEVTASFAYLPGSFGPTIGSLGVFDAGGALQAWVGVGGDLPDLTPPDGLSFTRGEEVASDRDDCGEWSYFAIEATDGPDSATLPYGSGASLGDLQLWHGGFEESEASGGCPDWFVSHVAVAAAPLQ